MPSKYEEIGTRIQKVIGYINKNPEAKRAKSRCLGTVPPRPSPPPPPLCKSLLVNSHFTAYPGCVQASNVTANSTLNSFRFKSYDVLLLLIITLLGLIKHTLTPTLTLTLTLTYHLPLPLS